jgi:hypothetical protein
VNFIVIWQRLQSVNAHDHDTTSEPNGTTANRWPHQA